MFADTAFTRKIDSLETGEIKFYLIIVSQDIIWVFPRHTRTFTRQRPTTGD